jgi:hypothetical protein
MIPNSLFKLVYQIFCLAKCKIGVEAFLEGEEAALLEPVGFPGCEWFEEEIGERRPLPDRQRLRELGRGRGVLAAPCESSAVLEQRLEAVEVELCGLDVEEVAGRAAFDSLGAEQSA